MKYRGIVSDVEDPKGYGRIKSQLIGFDPSGNETPWAWPCVPFGGANCGIYFLPNVGDEVWMERADNGWVWVGFCHSGRKAKPSDGNKDTRVITSPVGHQIKMDELGDVEVKHTNGSTVTLRSSGNIEINANGNVLINDPAGIARVVNTLCVCAFTGMPHPQGSRTVFVEGP